MVPDCRQRDTTPAVHRNVKRDFSNSLFVETPEPAPDSHCNAMVSAVKGSGGHVVGSSPVIVVPSGPEPPALLPTESPVVQIIDLGSEYLITTEAGLVHTLPATEIAKCPACTVTTHDPWARNRGAAAPRHRPRRHGRVLSVEEWVLRPEEGLGDGTSSNASGQPHAVGHCLDPTAHGSSLVTSGHLPALCTHVNFLGILSEARDPDVLPPGPPMTDGSALPTRNDRVCNSLTLGPTQDPSLSAALRPRCIGPGLPCTFDSAPRPRPGLAPAAPPPQRNVSAFPHAAAHAGLLGSFKGARDMVPQAAERPQLTGCVWVARSLYCAVSSASERLIQTLDRMTWTVATVLNVTALFDVVNLLDVWNGTTLVLGGHVNGHWEMVLSPIDPAGNVGPGASMFSTTTGAHQSCEVTLCSCYFRGINYCRSVARMATAGEFVFAAFPGNQVVYVIKVSVPLARIVDSQPIPAVYDRQSEVLLVTALALDDSVFQLGFVCFSKRVVVVNEETTLKDTPSTLFKWSMTTLTVTGSVRFQQVHIYEDPHIHIRIHLCIRWDMHLHLHPQSR